MSYIKLNNDFLKQFLKENIFDYQDKITKIHNDLHNKKVKGNDFLGWLDLPINYNQEEVKRIIEIKNKIQKEKAILVVIGIGGSYLGAKAGIDYLNFFNKNKDNVLFAGYNMSAKYLEYLLDYLKNKDFYLNVISKSGTTLEPAISFRLLKDLLDKKYQDKANERIIVTTDLEKGLLTSAAKKFGYEKFIIPANVGGRYSVLTAVGLLPLAVAGYDILEILKGAKDAYNDLLDSNLNKNISYQYALYRYLLYKQGKQIDLFVANEPNISSLLEWNKQLFGESEGKERKGLFPASVNFTTDLHSLGQYIQEGPSIMFETVLEILNPTSKLSVIEKQDDFDQLNYLNNSDLFSINQKALYATISAHNEGNVPVILLQIPEISPYSFGYLTYFFMKTCAVSGNLLDLNVFDQPGVEAYKKNMFKLLGKK